jgi:hypothetical protein
VEVVEVQHTTVIVLYHLLVVSAEVADQLKRTALQTILELNTVAE